MPKAVFVLPDGSEVAVNAEAGTNLMSAATQAGVEGIVGDCGGNLACSTCHVFVDESQVALLDPPGEHENEMLEYTAAPREPTSRLCCQIVISEKLDGIRVRVADPQV
ncbi:2Fe-2S ferredoxin [Trinickia symbiotica]|uniref:Ferredoxin n=1 Tax=Trinickia symbiotica TaxID=863227 RepID=A0A2N7WTC4_9BURK|nr:2Fe-2S iron-sulfur cluster-binding protein [Trinickia symbiotica]PMS32634.1 ferredoxin [Trinickia symbiotica]PPK41739.1 2Fe-2S ferredoxin [Trinickia symbiotica]